MTDAMTDPTFGDSSPDDAVDVESPILRGSTFWLGNLANTLRGEGCRVLEWDGWQNRSASKGGFVALAGIVLHHTASPPSWHGAKDWNYATTNPDNGPEYNVGIDPDGTVNVLAAGGVNSSGKGGPLTMPLGTVPQDGANYRLPAVSFGNAGDGSETYPLAQILAGVMVCGALIKAGHALASTAISGADAAHITAHKIWCGPGTSTPGRKIDPFGPWAGYPITADGAPGPPDWGAQQGDMTVFRHQLAAYLTAEPEPPPDPTTEYPMTYILESTVNDTTKGQMVVIDCGIVRSIGGGEKNALGALSVPKYPISSATEWSMIMAQRAG